MTYTAALAESESTSRITPLCLRDWLTLLVVSAITLVLFSAMIERMMWSEDRVMDFANWQDFAEEVRNGDTNLLERPHLLYPILVIALDRVVPSEDNLYWAGSIVVVASAVLTVAGIYVTVRPSLGTRFGQQTPFAAGLMSLALMLIGPITFLTPNHLYLGYVPAHVYHNPTMYLLKPFALPLFAVALAALAQRDGQRADLRLLAAAGLSLLATLAKPSLTVCLIPALALFLLYRSARRQPVQWALALAILVPALLALGFQYVFTYLYGEPDQIRLNPFGFFVAHGRFGPMLLPQYLLSIAFPLAVYGLCFRAARRDLALNFAWLMFLGGTASTYLFTETRRLYDGNFIWSGQITVFILFVVSVAFLLRQPTRGWGSLVLLALFGLHVAAGVYWYYTELARLVLW